MPDPASALQGEPGMCQAAAPSDPELAAAARTVPVAGWRRPARRPLAGRIQRESRELAATVEAASITAEIREQLQLHAQFLRSVQAFAVAEGPESTSRAGAVSPLPSTSTALSPAVPMPMPRRCVAPPERTGLIAAVREQADRVRCASSVDRRRAPDHFRRTDKPPLQSAVGFDLYSDAVRREAIETAIATRNISIERPDFSGAGWRSPTAKLFDAACALPPEYAAQRCRGTPAGLLRRGPHGLPHGRFPQCAACFTEEP